jgi:CheY-like chemotaxis protein
MELHQATTGATPSVPSSPPLRVMIVEDRGALTRLTTLLLEQHGHRVVGSAEDGEAAIDAALDLRPDLILLDIGLPKLNGYEVAKRLREHPSLDQSVLVAMTGRGRSEDRADAESAGFDFHLLKPFSFDDLSAVLAHAQQRRAAS